MGSSATPNAPVPHFVGRYEVLVPIASGGMATVYLARTRGAGGFEREVAVKLTHLHLRESQEFQTLLVEEAKVASAIRHNNVVSVLDVGDDPLGLFLVMDYVEGDTLSGLMRRARASNEKVPRAIAMRALLDALAGLHAAHETTDGAGNPLHIVHRDFSPQNILVGTDGTARLTDFGIAKATSRAGNTSTGTLKGKISYMSPEQARGQPLDRRADVWAAGVLAWEIVTGRPLWPRESEDVAVLFKIVTEVAPRLRSIDNSVSVALDEAIAKALSTDRADRWPSAAAFGKALTASVEVAAPDEVAEYVRKSAGAKIAQRRQQIDAIESLRDQMADITEAAQFTPSSQHFRVEEMPPAPPENAATDVVSHVNLSAAASPPAAPSKASSRWVVGVVGIIGGVVVLAAAGLMTLTRVHRSEDVPPHTLAARAPPPTPTHPIAPVESVIATAAVPTPLPSSRPAPPLPVVVKAPPTPVRPPTRSSADIGLAPSPYDRK